MCMFWLLKTAFSTNNDYGKAEREAQWATAQRSLNGLQPPPEALFQGSHHRDEKSMAEQAKKRAEVAR